MPQPNESAIMDEKEAILELGGGLQGRVSETVCALQCQVEAARRYLAMNTNPTVREDMEPLFDELLQNVLVLERLSSSAANIALARIDCIQCELEPWEIQAFLSEFQRCVNEDLALRKIKTRLVVETQGKSTFWAKTDIGMMSGIFANLISNSLQACPDQAQIVIACRPGREIFYADNGPGLTLEDYKVCLENGGLTTRILRQGCIGLILVRQYAEKLGWELHVEPVPGFALRMLIPDFTVSDELELHSPSEQERRCSARIETCVKMEFNSMFGVCKT